MEDNLKILLAEEPGTDADKPVYNMNTALKILILEDSIPDAEFTQRVLKNENKHCEFGLAMNRDEYLRALDQFQPDVILADNSLPGFSALEALKIIQQRSQYTPFILLTGTVSEEFAAGIIKLGADDYILKDRFARLPAAIDVALKQRRSEKELAIQNEEKEKRAAELTVANKELKEAKEELTEKEFFLRESQRAGNIGSYKANFVSGYWQSSETLDSIFGIDKNSDRSIAGWLAIVHPDDRPDMDDYLRLEVIGKQKPFDKEYRIRRINDKQTRWVWENGEVKFDDRGNITELIGTIQDITERKKAEEKLRESNERYEFVNKATRDTIWEWDYHTHKGKWGEGIMTTFGYSKDRQNYDETWVDEYIHPDDKARILKNIEDRIEYGLQTSQNEYRFRCADGAYKYVFDRGYILYDENKKPYRMIGAMTDLTEKKRFENELVNQQIKQQKVITETIIQTQEKERNELGRELHDNINQILATVKMYLGMVKAKENISVDLVSQSYEYVNEAMEEIRKLSHSLVTPSLGDFGLKEALQGLVENANLVHNLHVQLLFDEKYNEKEMDDHKELMIYRIVQEQMNNITKYAHANEAFISLKTDDEKLVLSVVDNGVGFDVMQKNKGIGLKNISSRVEFYSGNMNINSSPGHGCALEVVIPHTIKNN